MCRPTGTKWLATFRSRWQCRAGMISGRKDEVPRPPGGFVPQPEQVEQGTQTWAQELQKQENTQAPPVQEPLLRRSGNSLHQWRGQMNMPLSPRRHNRQQLTRFSRPRTPRSSDDSAQASSSSVFVASAGFPTQTQQASTWMFAEQTVQHIHPQGQMDLNNWHMQGQVAGGQAYQWETNTQSNFGVPVPNQEGQFFMHDSKNMQMQKCGNDYSSRNQESYVMHIRNLIHQYIFFFFSTTASATLPLRFLFCCPSGTSFAQKTYGTRLYRLCSCAMEPESDDDHPRLHISFTNPGKIWQCAPSWCEKHGILPDRKITGNPGSLVRNRTAANPHSYSQQRIQTERKERMGGTENDLMMKKGSRQFWFVEWTEKILAAGSQ